MKLYEIALSTTGKTQGSMNQQVEPNTLLSLRNVCQRGGKNPNTFELLTICRLLQNLKNGCFYKQSNPFEVNMSTSKELLDILRTMKPEDLCGIATKLNNLLALKDADAYHHLANPTQEYLMWLQFVQGREANESLDIGYQVQEEVIQSKIPADIKKAFAAYGFNKNVKLEDALAVRKGPRWFGILFQDKKSKFFAIDFIPGTSDGGTWEVNNDHIDIDSMDRFKKDKLSSTFF